MNNKSKRICLLLFLAILLTGCGKDKKVSNESDVETQIEVLENITEFPASYKHETGKVKFDCRIELPDQFSRQNVNRLLVFEPYYADREGILANNVDGKEILEKHDNPVDDGMPEENVYILGDGSIVSLGSQFSYGSGNAKFYTNVGAGSSENQVEFSSSQVSFAAKEDAIESFKQEMNKIGYGIDEFNFDAYPLSAEIMKKIEEQYLKEGYIANKDKKESWSKEDDAYMIYAYQVKDSLPIFHELMSINRMMAYDTPDNAPVQGIYSSRGLELMLVGSVYKFDDTDEMLNLKDFSEIAKVVEEKFENILNDASYTVNRAKLYQMVRMNENQKYIAEPIWYFEVIENDTSKSVTLVNAVTGKEIYLN